MDEKVMYAFRGWIAFVAFVDFGTAVRSYIEHRSFLTNTMPDGQMEDEGKYTLCRIVGMYSVLKALALIHCTLFIHYKPVVSMGICSIVTMIALYGTEVFYFKSVELSFLIVFPCILNVTTLMGLIYLPKCYKLWEPLPELEEEDAQLLKCANLMRRKRGTRKNH